MTIKIEANIFKYRFKSNRGGISKDKFFDCSLIKKVGDNIEGERYEVIIIDSKKP